MTSFFLEIALRATLIAGGTAIVLWALRIRSRRHVTSRGRQSSSRCCCCRFR